MRNIGKLIFESNEDTAYVKDYIFYITNLIVPNDINSL